MKFKVDENLPVEIAEILTEAGYDAVTVIAQRLQGATDSVIVETCLREDRVVVTLDLDFADIHLYPPHRYPGFIVLHVQHQNKSKIIGVFRRIVSLIKKEPLVRMSWLVEEEQVRIRGESEKR